MFPELADKLERFIVAQDENNSYNIAVDELSAGVKTSHWMWWVFPQLRALGSSERAVFYGIKDRKEARAYIEDPTLQARYEYITKIALASTTHDPVALFGSVDAKKVQASWTLFEAVADDATLYTAALAKFFNEQADAKTLKLI